MRKLSKLNINPEKLMKNEELVNLRGGTETNTTFVCKYGGTPYACITYSGCNDSQAWSFCQSLIPGSDMVYSCGTWFTCDY